MNAQLKSHYLWRLLKLLLLTVLPSKRTPETKEYADWRSRWWTGKELSMDVLHSRQLQHTQEMPLTMSWPGTIDVTVDSDGRSRIGSVNMSAHRHRELREETTAGTAGHRVQQRQ